MQYAQLHNDYLGMDNMDYLLTTTFNTDPGLPNPKLDWNCHDIGMDASHHYYEYQDLGLQRAWSQNSQPIFSTYDPTAHGFSYMQPHRSHNAEAWQPGLGIAWHNEQERHVRYVSPSASGFSMTDSDGAFSDYTYSPDVMRNCPVTPALGHSQQVFRSLPVNTHYNVDSAYPRLISPLPLPSMPVVPSQACNMKELQYTPDHHLDEGCFGDDKPAKAPIQVPEELALVDEHCPEDSGIDRSVADGEAANYENEMVETEEDVERVSMELSDDDSDFTLRSRITNNTTVRASLRSPRRINSYSGSATVGTASRVHKHRSSSSKIKSRPKIRRIASHAASRSTSATAYTDNSNKGFPCAFHHYGCTADFASKNEWKRHVTSQHLQLGFYRCDMGSCNPDNQTPSVAKTYNDFNRKDLFTQHCRRMHAPWGNKDAKTVPKRERDAFEATMDKTRERCWRIRRQAPSNLTCGICEKKFIDRSHRSKAWEERMEHMGKHYEKNDASNEDEKIDVGLRDWAVREGVVTTGSDGGLWLVGMEPVMVDGRSRSGRRSRRNKTRVHSSRTSSETGESHENMNQAYGQIYAGSNVVETDSDTDAEGEDE